MKPFLTQLALLLLLTASVEVAFSANKKENAATDAALQWLALVDSGQ